MHAFITQHVNYESIMRWRSAQPKRVKAVTPPPSLLDLWRFALVAQHTAWQNKYMPDVDPNRFVHQPPPLWVEQKGGESTPTDIEKKLWPAASAVPDKGVDLALEERLREAAEDSGVTAEGRALVETLEAMSGSTSWALND